MIVLVLLFIIFIEIRFLMYLNKLFKKVTPIDLEHTNPNTKTLYNMITYLEDKYIKCFGILNILVSLLAYYIGSYLVKMSKIELNLYYWCGIVLEYTGIIFSLLSIVYLIKNIFKNSAIRNKKSIKEFTEFTSKVLDKDDKGLVEFIDKTSDNEYK